MRRTALITIISAVLLSCCPVFAQDRSAGLNLSCNELAAAIHLPLDDEGILCVSANLDLTCVLSGKELFPGVSADIVYLYVFADRRFDSGESMRFYAGPGFSSGYVRNMDGEYGAMASMTGCVGFEYLFNVPFSISLTLEPALGIHFHQDEYGGVGMDFHMPGLIASLFPHLGIRYRF